MPPTINRLFTEQPVQKYLERRAEDAKSYLNYHSAQQLLNTPPEEFITQFTSQHSLQRPRLLRDKITQSWSEARTFARRASDPSSRGSSTAHPSTQHIFTVPFEGNAVLFSCEPSQYLETGVQLKDIPHARVYDNHIELTQEYRNSSAEVVGATLERDLKTIETLLGALGHDIEKFNTELHSIVRRYVESRRQNLISSQAIAETLGFPLKRIEVAAPAFAAPKPLRKVGVEKPLTPPAVTEPGTVLSEDDYSFILTRLSQMAIVLERSPSAFATMSEEHLRFLFLVPLNGFFESVSGEAFNFQGKTDILIRDRGKNIFIAECKFWKGSSGLLDTIDQILGYASWRDTKTAILLFNRNKNFSSVLAQIPETASRHRNFKINIGRTKETEFRFVFRHRDDPERDVFLTVLAFDVPT